MKIIAVVEELDRNRGVKSNPKFLQEQLSKWDCKDPGSESGVESGAHEIKKKKNLLDIQVETLEFREVRAGDINLEVINI